MKYMGSKNTMLKNGLGELIKQQSQYADRVVDLFTGSGSVSWYISENTNKPVLAVDLQNYSTILANAIINRTSKINTNHIIDIWINKAISNRNDHYIWEKINNLTEEYNDVKKLVDDSREICKKKEISSGPVWNAYGGYYFSPSQALTFDFLIKHIPINEPDKTVCLAACISAAIKCVASPGHTAQPFRPTVSAQKYILEAWKNDPIEICIKVLNEICSHHANVEGMAITADAFDVAETLGDTDLVFIDPPYSSVQYSRFYHVLETIARGNILEIVEGNGRYPPINERPQSSFCNPSQSKNALNQLLEVLAVRKCTIIFTFPSGDASNGLSGNYIKETASKWFSVEDKNTIEGKFSTLGGNNKIRDARKNSKELILLLKPK